MNIKMLVRIQNVVVQHVLLAWYIYTIDHIQGRNSRPIISDMEGVVKQTQFERSKLHAGLLNGMFLFFQRTEVTVDVLMK